jgi:predicted Rossmann-fold nucleotide-binding protein
MTNIDELERPKEGQLRILVCGGRDYGNVAELNHALHTVHAKRGISLIIEGGASGADRLAREWAIANNVPYQTFEADWAKQRMAAGPIRNTRMLVEGKPDGVIAFAGGRGTADMIRRAEAAGVKVWKIGSAALGECE